MFVAGGSGFVGSNICKEAVRNGFKVVSLSRTGRPTHIRETWADQVDWVQGDVQENDTYVDKMRDAHAVVSCIGRFGLGANRAVHQVNADWNIALAQLAKRECENLVKYAYISTQPYSANVQYYARAYFSSKLKSETIIQSLFPKNYLVMRPAWVFGWRHIAGPLWLPTQLIGAPIEHFMLPVALYCQNTKLVVPPTDVAELAHVVVLGCTLGRDVSGVVPTAKVRDVIERQAQGRALEDWLQPYQRQLRADMKEYLEETNWVEKYGMKSVGKQNMEKMIAFKRFELNPAVCVAPSFYPYTRTPLNATPIYCGFFHSLVFSQPHHHSLLALSLPTLLPAQPTCTTVT